MSIDKNTAQARMRVRARAVDMLGRQQIAGIPTAIHELFKNAHDAYADNVEVDYFREAEFFLLRDDGVGMTRSDFESKWLTLGTESKAGKNRNSGYRPPEKKVREIAGEKGIGRLAIATIGRQVLILTRAIRQDGLQDLVVALINWTLFEIPGIDLDEIIIPIKTISNGKLPDANILAELQYIFKQNLDDFGDRIPSELRIKILNDLDKFNFDLNEFSHTLTGPSLLANGHGTHFYILPTDEILQNDIDDGDNDNASNIEKVLLGFSNTMQTESPPLMRTAFRDHRENSEIREILGDSAFFTPTEFAFADQHITGNFDEYGQFSGTVSVYHAPPKEHNIRWSESNGIPTDCGPFTIRFAYFQGTLSDTLVPINEYADLTLKANRIGGLYIYKDGIRILPYGRSDYDFLDMESRRSKSAKDAFFSYRRLFGSVDVSNRLNSNLIEKAGREGFRENRAYRQLRAILINFFKQLALDFFAPNASDPEFLKIKSELQRQADLIKAREKNVGEKKKKFATALDEFFKKLESGFFVKNCESIKKILTKKASEIELISNKKNAGNLALSLESEIKEKISNLKKDMSLSRPRGIGFNKAILSDWEAYQRNKISLEMELLLPLENELDDLISKLNNEHINVNRRRRIANQLEDGKKNVQRRSIVLKREVTEQIQSLQSELYVALQEKLKELNGTVEQVLIDFERTDSEIIEKQDLVDRHHKWDSSIDVAMEQTDQYLTSLRDRLKELTDTLKNGEILDAETLGAVESQSEAYKEQLNTYFEFAQVGMALGIVQHEFSSTVRLIRGSIQNLKPWADGTPELRSIYGDIRHNFEHLDTYLNLFAPLNKRLYRKKKEMTGYEIFRYIENIFNDRLQRHNIKIQHSDNFDAKVVLAFPSTLLPVFVNIIDNAIYWITYSKSPIAVISLDVDKSGFLISNTGPGIEYRDCERIFDFGITRKSGGRGMGLYISRESLRRDGFGLELLSNGIEENPIFRISFSDNYSKNIDSLNNGVSA